MKTRKKIRLILALATASLLLISFSVSAVGKDELKIATWEDINTMDPGWLTSVERELTIMNCLYNGLVKYKEGSWEIAPDLAESWEMSTDGKEVTFHLRKGVKFQKGYGEMTAEDVKFSFERIIDPAAKSPEKGSWGQLDHVKVIDKYTVKLVLKDRMAQLFTSTLPLNAGMVVSKKAVEEMGKKKFGFNPIGTGPYQLAAWEPKKSVKLVAFKDYWGKKPKIKQLTFMPILEDSTCEIALKTGEIDIGRVSLINLKAFEKNPKLNVYTKPALKYWWLGFTVNKPPFDNLKLRQAVRYAIDVDKILLAAFYGTATRAKNILPPGMLGYWKDAPVYKVDLEKAKQLLKEGGKPNGFKSDLLVWTDDKAKIVAEVIKADLAKIGVEVDIQVKEVGAFNEATNKGQSNMHIQFFTTTIDPGYAMSWFETGNTWNPSQWSNKTYDELLKKGMAESDLEKRAKIYINAQKEIDKDCWAVWLTHGIKVRVAQSHVDIGKLYPNGRLAPWAMSFK
ncbi:MAG: ABC transporter substrate-binding protein [Pseudomonadota bacterium]